MTGRREGWESRLAAVVENYRRQPFAWGTADCFTFTGDCHQAVTGVDLIAPWRGRYADEASALRMVREHVGDLPALYRQGLGDPAPLPATLARRGDIAIVPAPHSPFQYGGGVVYGGVFYGLWTGGLIPVNLKRVHCFWKV